MRYESLGSLQQPSPISQRIEENYGTMDIDSVPRAITEKSQKSHRSAVGRKTSGKLPLQTSNSFILASSKHIKKLSSVNDDLKDVVHTRD